MKTVCRNNTHIENKDGIYSVRLHSTLIYQETLHHIVLNNGGWVTATTARRMNQVLEHRGIQGRVRIFKGAMYFEEKPFDQGTSIMVPLSMEMRP